MSKWINKDQYDTFADQKVTEGDTSTATDTFFRKWMNPKMGTVSDAKEYVGRLLPDPIAGFYKEYFYHGFMSGEKFKYFLCEKSYGLDKYCPFCEANKILYQGNSSDKKKAKEYRRKSRFVSNFFIKNDPRDADVKDDKYKVNGSVRLYEFPATVQSKIKNEITDTARGYGMDIFNPEDGYDFVLKIKAKPKDENGKEWPDYGDTMFDRFKSPIADTPEQIDALMETRIDLDKYIESLRLDVDQLENLLKSEMLWDDVGASFTRNMTGTAPEPVPTFDTSPTQSAQDAPQQESVVDTTADTHVASATIGGDDTDALLAELQDL